MSKQKDPTCIKSYKMKAKVQQQKTQQCFPGQSLGRVGGAAGQGRSYPGHRVACKLLRVVDGARELMFSILVMVS